MIGPGLGGQYQQPEQDHRERQAGAGDGRRQRRQDRAGGHQNRALRHRGVASTAWQLTPLRGRRMRPTVRRQVIVSRRTGTVGRILMRGPAVGAGRSLLHYPPIPDQHARLGQLDQGDHRLPLAQRSHRHRQRLRRTYRDGAPERRAASNAKPSATATPAAPCANGPIAVPVMPPPRSPAPAARRASPAPRRSPAPAAPGRTPDLRRRSAGPP